MFRKNYYSKPLTANSNHVNSLPDESGRIGVHGVKVERLHHSLSPQPTKSATGQSPDNV